MANHSERVNSDIAPTAEAKFNWIDPLGLQGRLSEEERLLSEAANISANQSFYLESYKPIVMKHLIEK